MYPFSKGSAPLNISHSKIVALCQQTTCVSLECSPGFCGNLPAQQWVWETSREKVNTIEYKIQKALNFSVVFFSFVFFQMQVLKTIYL